MFRSQLDLTPDEEMGLRDISIFAVRVYLKAWMTAPLTIQAPFNDLLLLKALIEYQDINSPISKAAFGKFSNHLWYLSECDNRNSSGHSPEYRSTWNAASGEAPTERPQLFGDLTLVHIRRLRRVYH